MSCPTRDMTHYIIKFLIIGQFGLVKINLLGKEFIEVRTGIT